MKKTNTQSLVSLKEVESMKQADRIKLIGEKAKAEKKIFLEMGLIRHFVEIAKRGEKSIGQILRAAGLNEGQISNGEYAAHAVESLLIPGLITESQYYNKLTFKACVAIKFALGKQNKKPEHVQSAETIAMIIKESKSIADDIESMANHDMLAEDYATEQTRIAEENRKQTEADAAALAANKGSEETETDPVVSSDDSGDGDTEPTPDPTPEPTPEVTETETDPEPEQETDPETTPEVTEETETAPTSDVADTGEILSKITDLEMAIASLPEDADITDVYKRLTDLTMMVGDSLGEAGSPAITKLKAA
jgi:hypothetical protein